MSIPSLIQNEFHRVPDPKKKASLTSPRSFAFVNGGSYLAAKVCHDEGNERCERYAGYIRDGYNLIFGLTGHNHGAAAQAHDTDAFNVEPGNTKRDDSPAEADAYASLVSILDDYNFGFDSIEAVDLSNANIEKRDASEPEMISRSIVRNFRTGNGTAADVALNLFSNGAATLDLAGDVGRLAAYGDDNSTEAGSIEKRFDGAGFKIAFTTRKKSLLTQAHQNDMSTAIANQWASRADGTDMDEYFGLVKTDHDANFYYRVISELRSFGLNYESVDVCGGMAEFL